MRLPWAQSFEDPVLETEYQVAFARAWRGYYRMVSVLLPVLFGSFAPADRLIAPEAFPTLLGIRVAVVTFLVAAIPFYFSRRLQDIYERHLQTLLLVEGMVAFGGLLSIGLIALGEGRLLWLQASVMGMLIAIAFVYASRMRFRYAALISIGGTLVAYGWLGVSGVRDPVLLTVSVYYAFMINALGMWIAWTLERDSREDFLRGRQLTGARQRTERLLHMVLPPQISERMRHTQGRTFAELHDDVTVVLADVTGFTPLCEGLDPMALGGLLDEVFSRFDELCDRHGVLKMKTLGDGWLACAGLPDPRPDHVQAAAALARDMQLAVDEVRASTGRDISLRIGVCTGPVVAGVIGRTRYAYDIWGEAVRGATRMEQGGTPGRVRLAPGTAGRLGPDRVVREGDGWWLSEGSLGRPDPSG
ncbi:MAG: hypothetical protein H6738_21995 [Alphaproteobacteria bacterium]|nr:hypothetical protein [Alphaproteobacteria bacterium]MCB9699471.1 hypothetical protein [Alphaproteobacteria bacterium]